MCNLAVAVVVVEILRVFCFGVEILKDHYVETVPTIVRVIIHSILDSLFSFRL